MLNKQPIFINSFARGGSNIIWEIMQSHPDAVSPISETDKIIWNHAGKWKDIVNIYLSVRGGHPFPKPEIINSFWMLNYGIFKAENHKERSLNKFARNYLDELLYEWKLKNMEHPFNKYKTETEVYTLEELKATRIVAKHVNGLAFLVPGLMEMYPDSIHFGLVRNGLALCESRLRRNTFNSAEKFGIVFNKIVEAYEKYEKKYSNFHIIRFEDFINDPLNFIKNIYAKARLTYNEDAKLRLKAKKHIDAQGKHSTTFEENSKYWIVQKEIFKFVNPEINTYQISRLTPGQKSGFLKIASPTMERYGYL